MNDTDGEWGQEQQLKIQEPLSWQVAACKQAHHCSSDVVADPE